MSCVVVTLYPASWTPRKREGRPGVISKLLQTPRAELPVGYALPKGNYHAIDLDMGPARCRRHCARSGRLQMRRCQGIPSFQSQPCEAGKRVARVISYQTADEDAIAAARSSQIQQEMDERSRRLHQPSYAISRSTGWSKRDQQHADCDAQKAYRQQQLDILGLQRTFDILQQLDDAVNRACSGL